MTCTPAHTDMYIQLVLETVPAALGAVKMRRSCNNDVRDFSNTCRPVQIAGSTCCTILIIGTDIRFTHS